MLLNQIFSQTFKKVNLSIWLWKIKRDINKQKKLDKVNVWKELLDFWTTIYCGTCYVVIYIVECVCPLVLQKKIGEVKENCMY